MEHNKMILAIVRGEDHYDTVHALNEKGFYVTVLSTSGGFLRQKNTTLMICTDETRVEEALAIQWHKLIIGCVQHSANVMAGLIFV